MSEEQILMGVEREKGILEYFLNHGWISEWKKDDAEFRKDAIQGLLDLYNKSKEKNKQWEDKIKAKIEEYEIMYNNLSKNPKEHMHSKIEYKIVTGVLQELLEEKEI